MSPRRPQNAPPSEAAIELVPVNPWRVPPSGSLGDAYDDVIQLDVGELAKATGERVRRHRPPKRQADEVLFLEWNPPLHWAVVLAWMFAAMAFFSTGPLYALMPIWAAMSALSAAAAVILLRTAHRQNTGEKLAIAAGCVALLLIGLDLWRPKDDFFQNYFIRTPRSANLEPAESGESTVDDDMRRMARIAGCAWLQLGDDATAVARYSVNSSVDPRSISFPISTLSRDIDMNPDASLGFSDYIARDLPRDPFSDDPYATFGVFITDHHLLVYSPGPDGDWDMNPREPVLRDAADPAAELRPSLIDPQDSYGDGDLVLILPLDSVEEWADCDALREDLAGRSD